MPLDYIAKCPECSRIVAWMALDLNAKTLAKDLGDWVRRGLSVERLERENVKSELTGHVETCKFGNAVKAKRRK